MSFQSGSSLMMLICSSPRGESRVSGCGLRWPPATSLLEVGHHSLRSWAQSTRAFALLVAEVFLPEGIGRNQTLERLDLTVQNPEP